MITIRCISCAESFDFEDPPENGAVSIARCPKCHGMLFPPAPEQPLFPRNVTHTREDF